MTSLLKKKRKVYLFTKAFKIKKSKKRLNYIKIQFFLIKEVKKLKIYELNLLKKIKVFFKFSIYCS